MMAKLKILSMALPMSLFAAFAQAESVSELSKRAQDAATVIEDIVSISDKSIPSSLLQKAVCVATIPQVIRAGFIVGARYGKGLVSCRTATGWSSPSFIQLRGGSWGAQFGVESIDLVLVFVQPNAVEKFSKDNFTIGADATVAAGPLGRDAQVGTDYKLDSEIYSYSKAKGLFAGLTIEGTALTVDQYDNMQIYGDVAAKDLLTVDNHTSILALSPLQAYTNALMTFAN
ncbi:MAG: lipid-binding SYLF domain-containing protein [Pseudobdellovibrionaceae bacterium]